MTIRLAVHAHSTWSYDGTWPLTRLASALRKRRYEGVLMAEHDRGFGEDHWQSYVAACSDVSDDSFTVVPGIEYSDADNAVHVVVWGVERFLGEGRAPDLVVEDVARSGGFAMLAHPARREAWKRLDPQVLDRLNAIEVWNRKYDGIAPGQCALQLAQEHPALMPLAGLDFHTARQFFPLGLRLDVRRGANAVEIVTALGGRGGRASAFGVPVLKLARGPQYVCLRAGEAGRRRLRRALRGTRLTGAS